MTFTDHFEVAGGVLAPQPWMQLRWVSGAETPATAKTYGPTGGKVKNDVIQTVQTSWTNRTPITQWVYGLVTQGGCAVALQCRSRAYLRMAHGYSLTTATPILVEVSRFGGGADVGLSGMLGIGTGFAIHEVRQPSTTMPFMPHITGWFSVAPGQTFTASVEVRVVSEVWEASVIDGGDSNTESMLTSGAVRLDLFAVPKIAAVTPRPTPSVISTSTGLAITNAVTVTKPTGVLAGDTLVAICVANLGQSQDITAPAEWSLLHSVNDGPSGFAGTHLRVFVKTAGASEPASYSFGNSLLSEEVVHILAIRNAAAVSGDAESAGWAVASTQKRWQPTGNLHVVPSVSRDGQMLIVASFAALTDSLFDTVAGPVPVTWTPPSGMTETIDRTGVSSSLSVAWKTNPQNPTEQQVYTPTPRAYFRSYAITLAIVVPGAQQFVREGFNAE